MVNFSIRHKSKHVLKYESIPKKGITTIDELPIYFQNIINTIILKYPDIRIGVFGSYYNGDYHNESSSNEFIGLKKAFKEYANKKFRVRSDLDLILNKEIDLKFDEVDIIVSNKIKHCVIIYDGSNLNKD